GQDVPVQRLLHRSRHLKVDLGIRPCPVPTREDARGRGRRTPSPRAGRRDAARVSGTVIAVSPSAPGGARPHRRRSTVNGAAPRLTGAGTGRSAGFVMARAAAILGGGSAGDTTIDGLSINGAPITVTGQPNQTIPLLGGRVVINEQQAMFPSGMAVNALHVVIDGVADVVIASATAGI